MRQEEAPSFDFEKAEKEAKAEAEEGAKIARDNGYLLSEIIKKQDGGWYEKETGKAIRDKRFDGIPRDDDAQPRFGHH